MPYTKVATIFLKKSNTSKGDVFYKGKGMMEHPMLEDDFRIYCNLFKVKKKNDNSPDLVLHINIKEKQDNEDNEDDEVPF